MLPKYHFSLGIIFVVILHFLFPQICVLYLSIIFLASFLIEIDHFFDYFLKKRDINPINAYKWYIEKWKMCKNLSRAQKKKIYSGFYIFHGVEVLIILFLLGVYFSQRFFFILIGFSFHFLLDSIHEMYNKGTFDKISLVYNYHRFRKLNP